MKNSCAKEPMATCTNCSECMWIVCGFGRRGAHPNLGIAPHYPCLHVEVEAIAEARAILKQEKKYKEADEMRAKVLDLGFTIEDVQGGKYRILPKA